MKWARDTSKDPFCARCEYQMKPGITLTNDEIEKNVKTEFKPEPKNLKMKPVWKCPTCSGVSPKL